VNGPLYYCPDGVARPSHIRAVAPTRVLPGFGVDGKGGTVYGGAWRQDRTWIDSKQGWQVSLDGVEPGDLMRSSAIPGCAVGDWLAPAILRHDGTACVGYWTADGFQVPPHLAGIVDRLRATLRLYQAEPGYANAETARLAADLLAINYHVSMVELGALAVLTPQAVKSAFFAAWGIAPEILGDVERMMREAVL